MMTLNLLSEQELAIIQFIHEFGFCEIGHIMQRFSIRRTKSYEQMKLLIRLGLINYKLVLPNLPGVYFLNHKAIKVINTGLPMITYIPTNNYHHHMQVLKVYLKIRKQYPENTWVTERRLIRQKHDDMPGNKDHLPDGILILPDTKQIAIEVELTQKARERLETILTDYGVDKTIHEVWYFCSKKVLPLVKEQSAGLPKIKTYLLDEELP